MSLPCINVDETSLKVYKAKSWIHVYSADDIILKFLHKNRGKKAIEEIDVVPWHNSARLLGIIFIIQSL